MAFWKRSKRADRARAGRQNNAKPGPDDGLLVLIQGRASSLRAGRAGGGALAFDPASAEAIGAAEESLDFALPPFLKRVFCEIGNGGFGPGQGLLGVAGGATDEHGNSLVDLYDSLSAPNPEDPGWNWPSHLVPLCLWGDLTYSCVDCSSLEGKIVTFDANGYRPGEDLDHFLDPQELTLDSWLRAWAEGVDLWSRMFPLE